MTPSSTAPCVPLRRWTRGVVGLTYAAWALWHLGYPDQALKRSHERSPWPRSCLTPLAWLLALVFAAMLHQFRREGPLAQERAEAAITLCARAGISGFWLARGTILRGWALAEQGQSRRGDCPDPPRPGRLPGHRGRDIAAIFSCSCWPRRMGKRGRQKKGLPYWPRRWLWWTKLGSVSTRRSCIG